VGLLKHEVSEGVFEGASGSFDLERRIFRKRWFVEAGVSVGTRMQVSERGLGSPRVSPQAGGADLGPSASPGLSLRHTQISCHNWFVMQS
jgi:hypothetical protein